MTDYTKTQTEFAEKFFKLPRAFRLALVQYLLFSIFRKDSEALVELLRNKNVTDREIAKVIGVDPSTLSRTYPKKGRK